MADNLTESDYELDQDAFENEILVEELNKLAKKVARVSGPKKSRGGTLVTRGGKGGARGGGAGM